MNMIEPQALFFRSALVQVAKGIKTTCVCPDVILQIVPAFRHPEHHSLVASGTI